MESLRGSSFYFATTCVTQGPVPGGMVPGGHPTFPWAQTLCAGSSSHGAPHPWSDPAVWGRAEVAVVCPVCIAGHRGPFRAGLQ